MSVDRYDPEYILVWVLGLKAAKVRCLVSCAGETSAGRGARWALVFKASDACRLLFYVRMRARGARGVYSFHAYDFRFFMTIDPLVPTISGRSMPGFHQPGRHCLHQARSSVRCSASCRKGELLPAKYHLVRQNSAPCGPYELGGGGQNTLMRRRDV